MKLLVAVLVIVLAFAGSAATAVAVSIRALDSSQHVLCPILKLATNHPVPKPSDPTANPSRVENYQFYLGFLEAKQKYGCH